MNKDIDRYSFADLADVNALAKLLDSLYRATGIPNGLVGPDGEMITQAGWADICENFHRSHSATYKHCQESNLELMSNLRNGEMAGNLCKNGLYDYATPIVIEGKQLATLFLCQVLNGPPDIEKFREQAAQFGFDEQAYLKAVSEVPVIGKEQMKALIDSMVGVAQVLAMTGLARLREQRLQQSLQETTERRIQIEDLLENSPVGISWCDAKNNIEYVNKHFTNLFGYTLEDIPDLDSWQRQAYPDADAQKEIMEPWFKEVRQAKERGITPPELESDIRCKDGSVRRVLTRVSWVGESRLANFTDITEHWRSEQRNRRNGEILKKVAQAEPLSDILNAIVLGVEAEAPGTLCSILLLDADGKHLYVGAAPNLPDFYNEAVNGLEIGMGVGSCGTAAYLGERVIAEDISTHEYWCSAAELAKKAGLEACWSEPILSSTGKVLGTFAIYHRTPAAPSAEDIDCIMYAANSASIAIENLRTRAALASSEQEFRSLAEASPDHVIRYDRQMRIRYINSNLVSFLGFDSADQLIGRRPSEVRSEERFTEIEAGMHRVMASGKGEIFDISIQLPDGGVVYHQISMVPEYDADGELMGVIVFGHDLSDIRQTELELKRSHTRLRKMFESSPDPAWIIEKDRFLDCNQAAVEILGYANKQQLLDLSPSALSPSRQPDGEDSLGKAERMMEIANEKGLHRFEWVYRKADGSDFIADVTLSQIELDSRPVIYAIWRDISERKQMEKQLEQREKQFRTLAESAPDNIARHDSEGYILYINPVLERTIGLPREEMIGKTLYEIIPTKEHQTYVEAIRKAVATRESLTIELPVPDRHGGTETHMIHLAPELDDTGKAVAVVAIGRDITDLKQLEWELEQQAHYDALTRLTNRHYFFKLANAELSRFHRYGGSLSLIMFDIDQFKQVNDSYGHQAGDRVLQSLANVCLSTFREIDIVGRIGGEEFAVVLPQTDNETAAMVAERLRLAIAAEPIELPNGEHLYVTVSLGVVSVTDKKEKVDALMGRADQALYRAKNEGRNRLCVAEDSPVERVS